MEEENKEKPLEEETIELTKSKLKELNKAGMQQGNIDYYYKVVDIMKDFCEMDYYKTKKEEINMRMRNYGTNYGNFDNYSGYGRRNYKESWNYGRRGYDTKYRGGEYINDMMDAYSEYSDGREMYGNDNKTMESYEYMLKSLKDFYKHLTKEASSQEEIEMLRDTIQEMAQM